MWKYYALASAFFAALTAILAKFGVKDINSNLATAIRTTVILILTWGIVFATGAMKNVSELSKKSIIFLVASGLATGLSWLFYFKAIQVGDISRVAPIDKLSVALVILFGIIFLHEKITWQLCVGSLAIIGGTLLLLQGK